MFSQGTKIWLLAPPASDKDPSILNDPAAILAAVPFEIAPLLDWSKWKLCLNPRAVSSKTYYADPGRYAAAAGDPNLDLSEGAGTCLDMSFGVVAALTDTAGWGTWTGRGSPTAGPSCGIRACSRRTAP